MRQKLKPKKADNNGWRNVDLDLGRRKPFERQYVSVNKLHHLWHSESHTLKKTFCSS